MILQVNEEGRDYQYLKCIERICENCGVDKFFILFEEFSDNSLVKWLCYEYVFMGKYLVDGIEKKIIFVQKEILLL